jgi:hypothetical protein
MSGIPTRTGSSRRERTAFCTSSVFRQGWAMRGQVVFYQRWYGGSRPIRTHLVDFLRLEHILHDLIVCKVLVFVFCVHLHARHGDIPCSAPYNGQLVTAVIANGLAYHIWSLESDNMLLLRRTARPWCTRFAVARLATRSALPVVRRIQGSIYMRY